MKHELVLNVWIKIGQHWVTQHGLRYVFDTISGLAKFDCKPTKPASTHNHVQNIMYQKYQDCVLPHRHMSSFWVQE